MSFPIVLLILLAAGAAGWWFFIRKPTLPAPTPRAPDLLVYNWQLEYSPGMGPLTVPPSGGLAFTFLPFPAAAHYLTTKTLGGLRASVGITAAVKVETTGTPTFVTLNAGQIDPEGAGFPAKAALYLQRRGDNLSGAGEYEYYRWWADNPFVLTTGAATLSESFADPSRWYSVYGKHGAESAETRAGFAAAIADLDKVGLTFGGRFAGHGVALANGTDGSANFVMTDFKVS